MTTPDITLRRFTWDDLPALVDLTNAAADVDQAQERFDAAQLREELEAHNDPTTDSVVALTPGGQIVGYAYVEVRREAERLWGFAWGTVHPAFRRRGIGRRLVRAAEARFVEQVPPAAPPVVFIQRFINDTDQGHIVLALAEGYTELRHSYRMSIALDRPIEPSPLPAGLVLRPFDSARDARAVYEAVQAAFMDGGGQVNRTPYDNWCAYHLDSEKFNPALWLIAYEGDQVVGLCIGAPWGSDDPSLGWIDQLGVLRPYRGRGLGEALLRKAFAAFQQQGYRRAALGVRADNPSALGLYHRAGMQIYSHFVHYRKVLRGDPAAIQS